MASIPPRGESVALFGLSADPPTGLGGHAGIVLWCATELRVPGTDEGVGEVWVLPVYRHMYAAKREMTPYEHRLAMAHLAFDALPGAQAPVRVVEAEREAYEAAAAAGPAPRVGTVDVVRRLRAAHPGVRFVLVLGADAHRDLQARKWKEADALSAMVDVVGLPRPGEPGAATVGNPPRLDEVSSSAVRASTDLAFLERALQPQVLAYVRRHRLYAIGAVR